MEIHRYTSLTGCLFCQFACWLACQHEQRQYRWRMRFDGASMRYHHNNRIRILFGVDIMHIDIIFMPTNTVTYTLARLEYQQQHGMLDGCSVCVRTST